MFKDNQGRTFESPDSLVLEEVSNNVGDVQGIVHGTDESYSNSHIWNEMSKQFPTTNIPLPDLHDGGNIIIVKNKLQEKLIRKRKADGKPETVETTKMPKVEVPLSPEEEEKRNSLKERNKSSAKRSREKKKELFEYLKEKNTILEREHNWLTELTSKLKSKVQRLKEFSQEINKDHGGHDQHVPDERQSYSNDYLSLESEEDECTKSPEKIIKEHEDYDQHTPDQEKSHSNFNSYEDTLLLNYVKELIDRDYGGSIDSDDSHAPLPNTETHKKGLKLDHHGSTQSCENIHSCSGTAVSDILSDLEDSEDVDYLLQIGF